MKKERCNDWIVTTIGVATSIYMLFMVQALRPYLVGNGQPHVHQPSMSPLLERVLVCITFSWSVKDLVHLESTLATIATYEADIHTMILTNDTSRLDTLLTDWGRGKAAEAVPMPELKGGDHSCGLPGAWMGIIKQRISASNYTSIIHLDPGARLTWAALASWALDTEVLEPLNLTRCFYHTTLSPETGEKVLANWVEPIRVGSDSNAWVDAMLENPGNFKRVSSRSEGRFLGYEQGGWAHVRACKVHRHFVSIDVQSCMSTNTWAFSREEWERKTRSLTRVGLQTTIIRPPCVIPYTFESQSADRPTLAPQAEIYHARRATLSRTSRTPPPIFWKLSESLVA